MVSGGEKQRLVVARALISQSVECWTESLTYFGLSLGYVSECEHRSRVNTLPVDDRCD